MATHNFFALLSDNEVDDPWAATIAPFSPAPAPSLKAAPASSAKKGSASLQPKLPSKPLPPAQAVRESRNLQNGGRGRGGGGRGNYRNNGEWGVRYEGDTSEGQNAAPRRQGFSDEAGNSNSDNFQGVKSGNYRGGRGNPYSRNADRSGDTEGLGQGGFRGIGRGRGDGEWSRRRESDQQPDFDHRNEIKGPGSSDDSVRTQMFKDQLGGGDKQDKKTSLLLEEQLKVESPADIADDKAEKGQKAEEDNEMTLDEYEKVLDEKRKALAALKTEERKVNVDKAFNSMQLVEKKSEDDVFIRLGWVKDKTKKEALEKEERSRKSVSINEFLKPMDGDGGFRTRGRGRGNRGENRGSFAVSSGIDTEIPVPRIEDPGQFPSLGGK